MTSDSITEQAARAEAERRYRRQGMHVGTPSDRERAAFADGAAWALAHQAPATEPGVLRDVLLRNWWDTQTDDTDPWDNLTDAEREAVAENSYVDVHLDAIRRHAAPATEDEAAEVEWGVILNGRTARTKNRQEAEGARGGHGVVYRTPGGPWVEVSS